jgi:hypothetical protein
MEQAATGRRGSRRDGVDGWGERQAAVAELELGVPPEPFCFAALPAVVPRTHLRTVATFRSLPSTQIGLSAPDHLGSIRVAQRVQTRRDGVTAGVSTHVAEIFSTKSSSRISVLGVGLGHIALRSARQCPVNRRVCGIVVARRARWTVINSSRGGGALQWLN